MSETATRPGQSHPLGATVMDDGTNFSLFSANATQVELLLFDRYDQDGATRTIALDPHRNRSYYYWHVFVPGVGDGQLYGYRVQGPYVEEKGLRFNGNKVLVDPYAHAVAYGENWSRAEAHGVCDNVQSALKSVVVDFGGFDWEGDRPLGRFMSETVIYEMHVRGLTADPSSGVLTPGSYRGVIEKIPYLKSLGITAVELLPVQQFDPQEVQRDNPISGEPLENYWGYAPVAYFAPHLGYASRSPARQVIDEFREMVKALHQAGIEVILDVAFNHTGEGDETGPTISFRGLENVAYYMLEEDKRYYHDFTGTGNTVNCNHSVVRRLIRQCLRHWVRDLHVDGFRFDLASVLSRGEDGEPMANAPILWGIESDPVLANTKLIAEAWDAAGLYLLGAFAGDRWAEWNGRFRDDVRRYLRGDLGTVRDLAWRMTGSFDIFRNKRSYVSHRSINYVTCHDGFTLADLVSYNRKHNKANGEQNRDGVDENYSWNHGVEGPSDDPEILWRRRRQTKNFLVLLFMARGTPMMLGGDEVCRTQRGNNNAYCQDNEISWFDWNWDDREEEMLRFARRLIALRRQHPTLKRDCALGERPYEKAFCDGVTFHGIELGKPDWSHYSHSLAIHYHGQQDDDAFYLISNAYREALTFELPPGVNWRRLIDTNLQPPHDICPEDEAPIVEGGSYRVADHSLVVLIGWPEDR